MGLTIAGCFVWESLVTSLLSDREASADAARLREVNPLVDGPVQPHTDFEAFPPPVVDTSADPWGLLVVPKWNGLTGVSDDYIDRVVPIKEGTTASVLDTGAAGHFDHTALPGQVGNFSLAGPPPLLRRQLPLRRPARTRRHHRRGDLRRLVRVRGH